MSEFEHPVGALRVVLIDMRVVARGRLVGLADDRPDRGLIGLVALGQQRFVLRLRFGVVDVDVLARLQELRVEVGDVLAGGGERLGLGRHVGRQCRDRPVAGTGMP